MSPFINKTFIHHPNRKGQSFVELALIIPILALLALGVFEYSNLFILGLKASALGREASNAAFRECRSLEGKALQDCLSEGVVYPLSISANHMLPNFTTLQLIDHDGACPGGKITDSCYRTPVDTGIATKGTLLVRVFKATCTAQDKNGNDIGPCEEQPDGGCNLPRKNYGDAQLLAQARTWGSSKSSRLDALSLNKYFLFHNASSFVYEKGGYLFTAEVFYKYEPITAEKSFYSGILPDEIYQAGFF